MKRLVSTFTKICAGTYLAATLAAQPALALAVISDLDDTIKHTHVGNTLETIYNGLFSKRSFGGMAALFTVKGEHFTVVSATPKQLEDQVRDFLRYNSYPRATVYLRPHLLVSTEKYKTRTLTSLLSRSVQPVALIGDDTEKDPEIYFNLRHSFPAKVGAIYVRHVRGRRLPAGVIGFYHPYEVAVNEWSAGRISTATLIELADFMIEEFAHDPSSYFPAHVVCPRPHDSLKVAKTLNSADLNLKQATLAIVDSVFRYCNR